MSGMGLIRRQQKQSGSGQGAGPPVPVRLRQVTGAGAGSWLKGALQLAPGSLLWVPDKASDGAPVELAVATMVPMMPGQAGVPDNAIELDTPSGRVQLEMDPVLFEMSQQLVSGDS